MNRTTVGVALASPIALILSLVVAVPLLLSDEDCAPPALTSDAASGVIGDGDATPDPATAASPARAAAKPAAVGAWKGEQLRNGAAVVAVGKQLGISERGQVIAIMTAMGESGLRTLDYGDAAGPDSRGLFQQRNSWGSLAQRMDPAASAELFYRAMTKVAGWQDLEPTIVAHRTQRNADPNHYTSWWDDAIKVYASLSGSDVDQALAATAPSCSSDDLVNASWTSGVDCDFQGVKNPRSCQQALGEATRIMREAGCRNEVRGGSWRRRCLEFVARAYGYRFAGEPTAKAMYRTLSAKGVVSKSKNIPAGALVFFDSSDPAGHVALYAGNGKAFSNDYIRSGCIDLTPMSRMGSGGRYLGWAPPVFPNAG